MMTFGSIVLVPFPFTNLSAAKVRPALVLSRTVSSQGDVIVCFITSQPVKHLKHAIPLDVTPQTGLKVSSQARLDKIATLNRQVILGEIGRIAPTSLRKYKKSFSDVFGF